MITELNNATFDAFIAQPGLVMVDFWAPWCGPCRMLAPIVHAVAEAHTDTLHVGKVNVDEASDISGRYGIQSIPTVLLFKDGRLVNKSIGYVPQSTLEAMLEQVK